MRAIHSFSYTIFSLAVLCMSAARTAEPVVSDVRAPRRAETELAVSVRSGHILTVEGGTGGGSYPAETTVPIVAAAAPAGQEFAAWAVEPAAYAANLADASAPSTTFTMPAAVVTLTATYEDIPYSGGSGTEADPYRVATKADLLELAANTDDYDKHFILTANIDLTGETFTAALIAPDTNMLSDEFQGTSFTGMFDGNGHIIRDLLVRSEIWTQNYLGLFGYLGSGAHITDLGMDNVQIIGRSGSDYLGGLCGYNHCGTVSNCYVIGTVTGRGAYIGGLCGFNYSGELRDCYVKGTVSTGGLSYYVGGLCGCNHLGTVSRCHATGSVAVNSSSGSVGGLCGANVDGTISYCHATTTVTGDRDAESLGGLCGTNSGTLHACYAVGTVASGRESTGVGGVCGTSPGAISDCYAACTVTSGEGSTCVGGICGANSGSVDSCYSAGSLTSGRGSSDIGGLCGNGGTDAVSCCYFYLLGSPDNGIGDPLDARQLQDAASFTGLDFAENPDDGTDDIWAIAPEQCPRLAWQQDEGPPPPASPIAALAGSGTEADPFVIANTADFAEFRSNARLVGGYYVLTNDIDMSGLTLSTAAVDRVFGGVFIGNGHVIRNLTIDTEAQDYIGLFASVCGTVRDLGLENVLITCTYFHSVCVGTLCGANSGTLSGCWANGSITAEGSAHYVGGLCGYNRGGAIRDCHTAGDMMGSLGRAGGICGDNDNGELSDCHSAVAVTGSLSDYIGGVCGYNYRGVVRNCYATGAVSKIRHYGGGLCGYNDYGSILGCYATGAVMGRDMSFRLGGFCGQNHYGTIKNCYSRGSVTGGDRGGNVAGFCGATDGGTIDMCYATGRVTAGAGCYDIGGFCGSGGQSASHGCFWDADTSGRSTRSGGTAVATAFMQTQATFAEAGWDFMGETANGTDDVWYMAGYPKLSVFISDGFPLAVENGSGGGSYPEGAVATVVADQAPDGQEFAAWVCEPEIHAVNLGDAADATTTFAMPDALATLTATYAPWVPYGGGSGSPDDPYLIATPQELLELAANAEDYDKHFAVIADIDLADRVFTAALIAPDSGGTASGFPDTAFTGSFCGRSHVIRNLTIAAEDADRDCLGLFGRLGPGAKITNVRVEDIQITGGVRTRYVGGICGYSDGGSIEGSHVTGSIVVGNGSDCTGGVCGYNSDGNIAGCSSAATTAGNSCVGGLCGHNSGGTIGNCYAAGITVGGDGSDYVGGLCGRNSDGSIENCYATGTTVSGDGSSYIGGLCGGSSGAVSFCYAVGSVESAPTLRVGGFCGSGDSDTFSHCYFHSSGGPDNGLGELLSGGQLQNAASFVGFDFAGLPDDGANEIWAITAGHSPRLAWQEGDGPLPPVDPTTSLAGSGTATDPFVIASTEDFAEFCGNSELVHGHYSLTCDVDLAGTTFAAAPIDRLFSGVFDGNGHVVRNLTIDTGGAATSCLGLFASIWGTLRDLGVEDVRITCGSSSDVGGLCGYSYGTISSCWATGSITAEDDARHLGGLCGYSDQGTIRNCYSATTVTGNDNTQYVGGLCGYSHGTVSDCYATGSVTGGNSSAYLGGLCGYSRSGNVEHCYATGSVTGGNSSAYLGGLCGYGHGTVSDCYATGSVTGGNSSAYLGGLFGYSRYGNVERCYATGSVTGGNSSTYLGGFCGEVEDGDIANCYSRGPVTTGSSSRYIGCFCGSTGSETVEHCYAAGELTYGTDSLDVGGFCGHRNYDGAIDGCFWSTDPPGRNCRIGVPWLTTAQMQTQATFTAAGWDFVGKTANGTADLWYMHGYPALSVFAVAPIQVLEVQNGSGGGSYEVGTIVTVTAEDPSAGQEFVGWAVDPTEYAADLADATANATFFTVPAANATLTATYATKTYPVTFDLGQHGNRTGGGELNQTLAHGTAAVAPEFTVEDGWVFTGWNKEFSAVTAGLTVGALYLVLDTDGDYLPDRWERLHFGDLARTRTEDSDGDGFTNWEESVVDTDPDDDQSYPRDQAALVWEDAVRKLRIIGNALECYMADHGPDMLPGRLMYLVDQGYLAADMLIAIGDESGGTDPQPDDGNVYADVYEAGVSFFYETSETHCPWSIPAYDGGQWIEGSWYDVRMYQLAHGRSYGHPYDRRAFPIVRFFWEADYPKSGVKARYRTSLGLAIDCRTVFASSLFWEYQSDVYLPDDPATLRPLLDTPLVARYTKPLLFPLWFAVQDVSDMHGLRLVASGSTRDTGTVGEIRGHYYTVTPDIDTPTAFTVTLEWDDGTGTTQQASFEVALDSGPADDPDEDGLDNAAELAAGTDPYDNGSNLMVSFDSAATSVAESAGTTTVRCQLSGTSTLPVTVNYAVTGGTATGGGVDYTLAAGTLTFAVGESEKDLEVAIDDDLLPEFSETVQIELSNPDSAVLGGTVLHTQTIVDDDPHTVTFEPGTHATRTGGGELVQQILHGAAALAPALDVEHGWQFVGWDVSFDNITSNLTVTARCIPPGVLTVNSGTGDGTYAQGTEVTVSAAAAPAGWQFAGWTATPAEYTASLLDAAASSTTFTMPASDATLGATYERIPPAWSLDLTLVGAGPGALTFGMRADATDGWDDGIDTQRPLPATGQACLASDDLALSYSTDYHALAETGEYLLIVSAGDEIPATVSWDVAGLPAGKYLSIYQVALGAAAPERAGGPGEPVGNTALNMALSTSLEVPVGEMRGYVIRYGDELVFDLALEPGWNLVSLPIEPIEPALDTVLSDGLGSTVHGSSVRTWNGQEYAAVAELHACVGYWLYAPNATIILVEGRPSGQTGLDLAGGWNQCGVEVDCQAPDDARIIGTPWAWNPVRLRYEAADVLRPGLGYWINVSEDIQLPLQSR